MSTKEDQEYSEKSAESHENVDDSVPLFQIKKWRLVAYWKWEVDSDICAICRATVMDACIKCESDSKSDDCVIVWGQCNHSFHHCCMEKWIRRNNRCPLCQQEWRTSRSHRFGETPQPKALVDKQAEGALNCLDDMIKLRVE